MSRHQPPPSYYSGRDTRNKDNEKSANPFTHMTSNWSWWMAGWNDADIALEATHGERIRCYANGGDV